MDHSTDDSVPLLSTPRRKTAGSLSDEDSPLIQDSPCNTSAASTFEVLDWDSSSSIYGQDDPSDDEADWTLLSNKRFSQPVHQPPPLFSPKLGSEPFDPPQIPPKSPERFRKLMRQYMKAKYAESELKEFSLFPYLNVKDLTACMRVCSEWYDGIRESKHAQKQAWFGPLQLPPQVEEHVLSKAEPDLDANDFYLNPFLATGLSDLDEWRTPFSLTDYELDVERNVWVLKVLVPLSVYLIRFHREWRRLRVAYASRGSYEVEVTVFAWTRRPLTLKGNFKCSSSGTVHNLLSRVGGELGKYVDSKQDPQPRTGAFRGILLPACVDHLRALEKASADAYKHIDLLVEQHMKDVGQRTEESPKALRKPETSPAKQSLRPQTQQTRLPIHHKSTLWKKIADSKSFLPKAKPSTASSQGTVSQIKSSCSLQQSAPELAQILVKYGSSMLPVPSSKLGRSITGRRKAVSWEPASKDTDQRSQEAMELAVLYGLSAQMRRSMPQLI
ncbi:hypothetical protein CBER1_02234 [Cercospora berteroae]|uniref:F-box domain-containing protein n=1 Tax=Cercospora berteroae TaxID=357750 RepID=A0A2S6CAY6_9PEZI|nr:hypothetical protein CBER1_02234 [Cercospora berteroae]